MARAAVGIRIPMGMQNAENGVVWGGLKRYFRLIKNPHRIPMGLWGWKIIPTPTPYPWGSPWVWVWGGCGDDLPSPQTHGDSMGIFNQPEITH